MKDLKKRIAWILLIILLTGATILCCIRWKAWFYNPVEPKWPNDTVDFSFRTFGQDTVPGFIKQSDGTWLDTVIADTLSFLVFGDIHNNMTADNWNMIAARHPHVDFYAQAGDFMERGYFYYYQLLASKIVGTPFEQLPVIVTPGNHEYRKGLIRRLPNEWKQWFPNPQNGPVHYLGTTYYVDFKNLRFIVIDTGGLQKLSDYTIVLTWLNRTLDSSGHKFTVVMMHHPVYSGAVGRQNIGVKAVFHQALEQADVVFSGHDHNYTRRLPFIGTNSAEKFYLSTVNEKDERICSGERVYELITLTHDTLRIQTYLMESGLLYDNICVTHDAQSGTKYDCDSLLMSEIILLPEKYSGKKNYRTRRFMERKEMRLDSVETLLPE